MQIEPRQLIALLFLCITIMGYGQQPQQPVSNDCDIIYTQGISYTQISKYQEAYQTFKQYIDSCYSEYQSWRAFGRMTSANTNRLPDTIGKNAEYREWLKKVLYYNTVDPFYYCEDLVAVYTTYLGFDKADGADVNAAFSVAKFIIDSTECEYTKQSLNEELSKIRQSQYEIWIDSVKDPIATPFDTTSPSIDELDLAIIRKSKGAVLPSEKILSVLDLKASPNPFANEIAIEYSLAGNSIMNIEIQDVLGREIYRTGRRLQSIGTHKETIKTNDWQEGTYFARLITSQGESKTVKIILQR